MIVLRTKKVNFEVTYINLREKPDWFLKISPHGKVPVLSVGDDVLFESNAIAEFLDETVSPKLHPTDAIKRARNRAWTDFVPDFSKGLSAAYRRDTVEEMEEGRADAEKVLAKLEDAIKNERGNDGPYFNGDTLCLVDAAYAVPSAFHDCRSEIEHGPARWVPAGSGMDRSVARLRSGDGLGSGDVCTRIQSVNDEIWLSHW